MRPTTTWAATSTIRSTASTRSAWRHTRGVAPEQRRSCDDAPPPRSVGPRGSRSMAKPGVAG
eukprot:351880-Chlamydomonas_euryale.AAC.1